MNKQRKEEEIEGEKCILSQNKNEIKERENVGKENEC